MTKQFLGNDNRVIFRIVIAFQHRLDDCSRLINTFGTLKRYRDLADLNLLAGELSPSDTPHDQIPDSGTHRCQRNVGVKIVVAGVEAAPDGSGSGALECLAHHDIEFCADPDCFANGILVGKQTLGRLMRQHNDLFSLIPLGQPTSTGQFQMVQIEMFFHASNEFGVR